MQDRPSISVVIPVFGSATIMPRLVANIETILSHAVGKGAFELILVNDCGPDEAWAVILELARTRPWLRGVDLAKNAGQHNAIMAGLNLSSGGIVVTMDDDLQHDPSDIPRILAALDAGHDLCYVEFGQRHHAAWKRIGSRFNGFVAGLLLDKPRSIYLSPYRGIRRNVVEAAIDYKGPFVYIDGLLLQATGKITTIKAQHHERTDGASGYSLRKSLSLWLKMATSFSVVPLRLVSLAGILGALIGFLLAVAVLVQKLIEPDMAIGWPSLIICILLVGSLQLLALGAVGEYIGRILLTINRKPQYVVRETVNAPTLGDTDA